MPVLSRTTLVAIRSAAALLVVTFPVTFSAQASRAVFKTDPGSRRVQEAALETLQGRVPGPIAVRWNKDNATPVEVTGPLTQTGARMAAGGPEAAALSFLASETALFGLRSPVLELRAIRTTADATGAVHILFDRVYKGLRVFPSQLAVHFSADGSITSVNGRYHPSFDIDVTPRVTAGQAVAACQQLLRPAVSARPTTELLIYGNSTALTLAWEVLTPIPGLPRYRFVVDATTGDVVVKDPGIQP